MAILIFCEYVLLLVTFGLIVCMEVIRNFQLLAYYFSIGVRGVNAKSLKKPVPKTEGTKNQRNTLYTAILLNIVFFFLWWEFDSTKGFKYLLAGILIQLFLILFIKLLYTVFHVVIDYLTETTERQWIVLCIPPIFIILMERQMLEIDLVSKQTWLITLFGILCYAIEFIIFLGTIQLMVKLILHKNPISKRNDKKFYMSRLNGILLLFFIVMIQMSNFIAILYSLNIRFGHVLQTGAEHYAIRFYDLIYYVCMTYTTIGYGDFTPATPYTKILTCIMSIMGFFTNACLISIVIGDISSTE